MGGLPKQLLESVASSPLAIVLMRTFKLYQKIAKIYLSTVCNVFRHVKSTYDVNLNVVFLNFCDFKLFIFLLQTKQSKSLNISWQSNPYANPLGALSFQAVHLVLIDQVPHPL